MAGLALSARVTIRLGISSIDSISRRLVLFGRQLPLRTIGHCGDTFKVIFNSDLQLNQLASSRTSCLKFAPSACDLAPFILLILTTIIN